ncbi:MAG: hypothetical protein ABGY96_21010 [bacterium]|nr:hypothetical protein [Gammaproteobacteria bacterium]HIL96301.1 hypothetical protein [Pseudomonadales bacterium]
MNKLILAGLLCVATTSITSCTTTKVHLFTEGLTQETITYLQASLDSEGYVTLLNSLPVPEGIITPMIVYSPMHSELAQVEQLRDFISTLGYEVDLEPVSRGNHFYTSINVGVYLSPYVPGRKRVISILGKELFGVCPSSDATLALDTDLTFALKLNLWDEQTDKTSTTTRSGKWRQSDDTVYFEIGPREISFTLSRFQKDTDYAHVEGIRLRNDSDSEFFDQCHFTYTELIPW